MAEQVDPNISKLEDIVANLWQVRGEFFNRFFGQGAFGSINECWSTLGYPESPAAIDLYRILYDRDPIGNRIVQVLPKECWQVTPEIFEDEESDKQTDFEKAWDTLGRQLRGSRSWYKDERGSPVWEYLLRADILSGIGTYGVILLGIDDGKLLEQPVEGAPKDGKPTDITGVSKDIYGGILPTQLEIPFESRMGTDAQYFNLTFSPAQPPGRKDSKKVADRRLLFLRCFDATLVQVVQYEADIFNPRFGQPLMYWITLNDPRQPHSGVGLPLATVRVHWSRVIHIADNLNSSEIYGFPRMQPVLNRLLDLQKLYGGSGEMYWRGAFPGLSIETLPQLGGDVNINIPKLRGMMENYSQGLDRWIALMGMTAKSLAPQVVDPTPQITVQLEAICIEIGIPVRVFKGSERGELASSQDDSSWNDRLAHRQQMYITPRIIVPFIDRLIMLGILPEPGKGKARAKMLDAITVENARRQSLDVVRGIGNDLNKWDEWFNVCGLSNEWSAIRTNVNPTIAANYAKMMELTRIDRELKQSPLHNAFKFVSGGTEDDDSDDRNADHEDSPDQYMDTPEEAQKDLGRKDDIDPEQGFSVVWPDLDSTTKKDKATIALQVTQAMGAFVSGQVESVCDTMDWYTRVLGWTEEEAAEVVFAVKKKQEEDMMTKVPEPGQFDKPAPPMMMDPDGKPLGKAQTDDKGNVLPTKLPPSPSQSKGSAEKPFDQEGDEGGKTDVLNKTTENWDAIRGTNEYIGTVEYNGSLSIPWAEEVTWNPITGNWDPNQERDEHGRFATGGGGAAAEAKGLAKKVWSKGGFTYQPLTALSPRGGFIVSLDRSAGWEHPLSEEEFKQRGLTEITEYLKKVRDAVQAGKLDGKVAHAGAWLDKSTHRVVLDVNEVYKTKEEALNVGHERKQDAIFDLGKLEEIDLRKATRNLSSNSGRRDRRGTGRDSEENTRTTFNSIVGKDMDWNPIIGKAGDLNTITTLNTIETIKSKLDIDWNPITGYTAIVGDPITGYTAIIDNEGPVDEARDASGKWTSGGGNGGGKSLDEKFYAATQKKGERLSSKERSLIYRAHEKEERRSLRESPPPPEVKEVLPEHLLKQVPRDKLASVKSAINTIHDHAFSMALKIHEFHEEHEKQIDMLLETINEHTFGPGKSAISHPLIEATGLPAGVLTHIASHVLANAYIQAKENVLPALGKAAKAIAPRAEALGMKMLSLAPKLVNSLLNGVISPTFTLGKGVPDPVADHLGVPSTIAMQAISKAVAAAYVKMKGNGKNMTKNELDQELETFALNARGNDVIRVFARAYHEMLVGIYQDCGVTAKGMKSLPSEDEIVEFLEKKVPSLKGVKAKMKGDNEDDNDGQ